MNGETAIRATALTKPEATAAVFATAGLWLLLRRLHGSRLRRELTLFLAPALAIPALAYGALATAVGPHDLLFENLYPVDMLRAGGNELVSVMGPDGHEYDLPAWAAAIIAQVEQQAEQANLQQGAQEAARSRLRNAPPQGLRLPAPKGDSATRRDAVDDIQRRYLERRGYKARGR